MNDLTLSVLEDGWSCTRRTRNNELGVFSFIFSFVSAGVLGNGWSYILNEGHDLIPKAFVRVNK